MVRFIAQTYRRTIRYLRQKYRNYKLKKAQKSVKILEVQADIQKDIRFLENSIKQNGSVHADLSLFFYLIIWLIFLDFGNNLENNKISSNMESFDEKTEEDTDNNQNEYGKVYI